MRSIGAVVAAAVLLGACSSLGQIGVAVEIRPDSVGLVPMESETGEGRSTCPADVTGRFSC